MAGPVEDGQDAGIVSLEGIAGAVVGMGRGGGLEAGEGEIEGGDAGRVGGRGGGEDEAAVAERGRAREDGREPVDQAEVVGVDRGEGGVAVVRERHGVGEAVHADEGRGTAVRRAGVAGRGAGGGGDGGGEEFVGEVLE